MCKTDYSFKVNGKAAEGILPDGTHFLIDAEDIPLVSVHSFHLNGKGYIISSKRAEYKQCFFLHWLVLGYTRRPGFQVDHINREKTDCRKCNLRPVTNQQNCMNRGLMKTNKSGYVGAFYYSPRRYYISRICINNKRIALHHSDSLIECAQAYNIARAFLFGNFAGHKNEVPDPSPELIHAVEEKCRPYLQEAVAATEAITIQALSRKG